MDAPVAHPPAYHTQLAPVPKVPETTLSVELVPPHIADGLACGVGVVDGWFTLIVTLAQVVVSQAPSALT
jgi:hypothetical protein